MRNMKLIGKLKTIAKQLKTEIVAIYLAAKDRETPLIAKVVSLIVVSYALSPIDLLPDFIPIIGYLDDLILLPLGIRLAIYLVPKPILERCRHEAKGLIEKNFVGGKVAGGLVLLIWIALLYLLVKKLGFL